VTLKKKVKEWPQGYQSKKLKTDLPFRESGSKLGGTDRHSLCSVIGVRGPLDILQ
jgi:hypothetical protein